MSELGDRLYEEMNKQIQEELYSAYLYYAMAAWFDSQGLTGFGQWMKVQAMEEVTHAHRFYNHIIGRGNEVNLLQIDMPKIAWSTPLEAAQAALNHEKHITSRINLLVKIAREEDDYTAEVSLLNWFVDEQLEEEENTGEIVDKLKLIGDSKNGLYQIDKELGARVLTVEADFKW